MNSTKELKNARANLKRIETRAATRPLIATLARFGINVRIKQHGRSWRIVPRTAAEPDFDRPRIIGFLATLGFTCASGYPGASENGPRELHAYLPGMVVRR